MINDWTIRRCKLERFTWELPIESLRSLSGKSAEPGRHNSAPQYYSSFPTRTKVTNFIFSDIFRLKCSVCSQAHTCCALVKRLIHPAEGGWPCVVSRRRKGKAVGRSCVCGPPTEPSRPVGSTAARTKNLVSIANCWCSCEYRVDPLGQSCHLS